MAPGLQASDAAIETGTRGGSPRGVWVLGAELPTAAAAAAATAARAWGATGRGRCHAATTLSSPQETRRPAVTRTCSLRAKYRVECRLALG